MSEIIIESNFIKDYKYFRIPGIISTDNNNLIIYYECRKESCDWVQIDIGMKKAQTAVLAGLSVKSL